MRKIILPLIISFLFASCSLNKKFLEPSKIPINAKSATIINHQSNDTLIIKFSGAAFQPTFIKHQHDTVDLGYTIESVVFKSATGNRLNGWFLRPKNPTLPITLLHFHGNEGNLLNQYQSISQLAKNGFQVFMFDYSGFGFSEGDATRENVLTDALSALDYVKSNARVANTKLIIYGQSLGGHLAVVVASQRQSDIDGLVIEGAFSSHKDMAAYEARKLFFLSFAGRILTKSGYSAMRSIGDFHKPLLVIHSSEDEEVPFYMGRKIFEKANDPKEFYEIKGRHMLGPIYYTDVISQKIINMLVH